jgi:hypothetical protein
VPAGEEVALEPPLAEVLGEDLHDAAVACEAVVGRLELRVPRATRDPEDIAEAVRRRLVRPEEPESGGIAADDVGEE